MSITNSIALLLNIQDKNIVIEENSIKKIMIKGVNSFVVAAKLSFAPTCCPNCACVYNNHMIHKHGGKRSRVKLPEVSKTPTYLNLFKQRFLCHHCKTTFFNSTTIVKPRCFLSNNTKHSIALDAKQKSSEKDIAYRNNVSHMTVNRIINTFYDYEHIRRSHLPQHLCFDEFKSVKASEGCMSFIFMNAMNGQIIDIVEDRRLSKLTEYFRLYTHEARAKVMTITIDMYSPYMTLIKTMFPNACIITDKFHTVQLISRSLNKTRIKVMNENKQYYNKLKRYWKLLLKNYNDLDDNEYKKYRCFKQLMRENDIVNFLIDTDETLRATYEVYQRLLSAIKEQSQDKLSAILKEAHDDVSSYMQTSLSTLRQYKEYIDNSFTHPFTNGRLEGTNNLIKVIKRIAFGYRSFYHFRIRILVISNDLSKKKKQESKKARDSLLSPAL